MEPRTIEMFHVAYADAVGYTKLGFREKSEFDDALSRAVAGLPSGGEAAARVDNGDGFALAFRGDPATAAEAVFLLRTEMRKAGGPEVRYGLHTGPAYLRRDLSGSATLSGQAIEQAQRLMVMAEGGQVLCSPPFAASLSAHPAWAARVGAPIFGRAKDGSALEAWQLEEEERPLLILFCDPSCPMAGAAAEALRREWPSGRVCIPDEDQFLRSSGLLRELTARSVGMAGLDFGSRRGSFLREELLPGTPGARVYVLGEGQAEEALDGESAAKWILDALGLKPQWEPPGGAPVPLDSPWHVARDTDEEMRDAISQREGVVILRGPRQFGKSTLLLRALRHAEEEGLHRVFIDLSAAEEGSLGDAGAFSRWVIAQMYMDEQPDLTPPLWEEWIGPNSALEAAVRKLLTAKPQGLLLVFEEVDRLMDCPFRDDFFGLLRSWHNRRALASDPRWTSLSLLLCHSASVQSLVKDVSQSPFNVGRRIDLLPFTEAQVEALCEAAQGSSAKDIWLAAAGHPSLSSALAALGYRGEGIPEALASLSAHPCLRSIGRKAAKDPRLMSAIRTSLTNPASLTLDEKSDLIGLGLYSFPAVGPPEPASPLARAALERLAAH